MSLRDQLLQAGLVSKDKAKDIEKAKKQQNHIAHKDKQVKAQLDADRKQRDIELKAFDDAKRLIDLEKNQAIEAKKQQKEARIAARRILDEKRLNEQNANDRFNFCPDGKKIRFVLVTPKQRIKIGLGEIAICRNDRDGFDYPLISREHALKLQELAQQDPKANWVLLLNDPNESQNSSEADDEWAAWDAYEQEKEH